MSEAAEKIRACAEALGVTMTAEFVPWSKSRNKDEKRRSLNWKVSLHKGGAAFLTTDYSAGEAFCPSYQHRPTDDTIEALRFETEQGFPAIVTSYGAVRRSRTAGPILPDLADVLWSLALDSSVLDHPTYETWAGDVGFDTDSRKGEATYRACLEIALKMRNALGDDGLRRLVEACEGY